MTAGKKPAARPIDILIDDPAWRSLGTELIAEINRGARLAFLHAAQADAKGGLTVLLTGDERVRALNRDYRGKNRPTNVLSFPSRSSRYLGDIAIASGVAAQEADAAGLPLIDHVLHLVVHGVLHLLGYDHEFPREAEDMELLEAKILAEMNIPNPHLRRGAIA